MIVLAPTKLPNGQYEWLNELAPAELPQWVADLAGTVSERNEALIMSPVPSPGVDPVALQVAPRGGGRVGSDELVGVLGGL
jgi:hypothetical protein